MSLLIYQECNVLTYSELKKWEKETIGELKTIQFFLNKREDRHISKDEENLLIAWHNGQRTEENILI